MITPKVTVLMSVYNGERYLHEAIDSILTQSFTDFEFIIINDASSDSTAAILESYIDPRLVYLNNETNLGLTQSLNRGLAIAQGEYVARMDADDISLPERLAQQVAFLEAQPEVGAVSGQVNFIDDTGRFIGPVHYPTDPLLLTWMMQLNNCIWHPTVMFRRELVQSLGGYDPEFPFAQDYDLWLRLQAVASIRQLHEFLLNYRSHPGSITWERFEEQERCLAAIVRKHTGSLLTTPLTDELIFAMRQVLGIYPNNTRPVSQEAIDVLVELLAAFCRRRQLDQAQVQQLSHHVTAALIHFAAQTENSLSYHALHHAIQLDNEAVLGHIVNLKKSIAQVVRVHDLEQLVMAQEKLLATLEQQVAAKENQVQSLEQSLAAIEQTKIWWMAQKWYAIKLALGRLGRYSVTNLPPLQLKSKEEVDQQSENAPVSSSKTQFISTAPKVLFISHDAKRNGAPILLLNFLKWFKANTDIPFEVLLKVDGELRPEFESLAPVWIWHNHPNLLSGGNIFPGKNLIKKITGRLGLYSAAQRLYRRSLQSESAQNHLDRLKTYFQQANIRLIYANTITNGEILEALSFLNCPVICHVHELEYWIKYQTAPQNDVQVQKYTNFYIAVSQAVRQNLVANFHVPEERIETIYEYTSTQINLKQHVVAQATLRRQLNIPANGWVVGASGTTDWRKGPELFIQLARAIYQRQPEQPVFFVWVGGEGSGPTWGALQYDLKQLSLESYVHFIGAQPNPLDYFAMFDVFALTSREDPYPLVNLETASLGKPIVCFDGAGGAKEFVEDDCGFVVPYLDIEGMAERVLELLRNPTLRQQLGARAAQKVRERHELTHTAPRIAGIIQRFLNQPTVSTQPQPLAATNQKFKPEHLAYIANLSGEEIARQVPVRLLIKGVGYKIAAKPGFGWLYHFRGTGKKVLDKANKYVAPVVHYQYDGNFHAEFKPYQVQILHSLEPNRPRILHALANFKTGGSAQLVVDLIEHLGHRFEQEIITRYNPKPPNYVGPKIHEYPDLSDYRELIPLLEAYQPDLVHVHYWGEYDKGWYEQVFQAVETYGGQIIENINVPIWPRSSPAVQQYVYVSDYVCQEFGSPNSPNPTIYPGSDLDFFSRKGAAIPDNCIGMVYRLENDKVNDRSIEIFIKVVQRRPETKVLIVGGGENLEVYRTAVNQAGLNQAFTFTGYVSYQQLPALYKQLSLFVAPVVRESFGQVTPFAMGMEIPVVGYNVGALAEILGSEDLLAPPGDSDVLANIIIELLNDRSRCLQIGAANYRRAHRLFSVEAMIQKYNELYERVLTSSWEGSQIVKEK